MLPYIGNIFTYILCVISLLYIVYQENHGKVYGKRLYSFYLLTFILFGTFAYFAGDYVHYRDEIERLQSSLLNVTHLEPIYVILIWLTNGNYHLWRLCIYLTIFLLLNKYLKLANQNNYHTLFWFAFFLLQESVTGRVPISILSFFICLLYFIDKKRLLGACFLVLAAITHKSILPILLLIPAHCIKLKSKYIPILLCFLPAIGLICNLFLFDYLINWGIIRKESFEVYSQTEYSFTTSIGGIIEFILYTIPYNILILIYAVKLFKTQYTDERFDHLRNFCLWFMLLLLLLLFMFGFNNPMFYRYYLMIKYPLLLLLPYSFPNLYQFRLTKSNFYFFLYFFFMLVYKISLSAYYEYCG